MTRKSKAAGRAIVALVGMLPISAVLSDGGGHGGAIITGILSMITAAILLLLPPILTVLAKIRGVRNTVMWIACLLVVGFISFFWPFWLPYPTSVTFSKNLPFSITFQLIPSYVIWGVFLVKNFQSARQTGDIQALFGLEIKQGLTPCAVYIGLGVFTASYLFSIAFMKSVLPGAFEMILFVQLFLLVLSGYISGRVARIDGWLNGLVVGIGAPLVLVSGVGLVYGDISVVPKFLAELGLFLLIESIIFCMFGGFLWDMQVRLRGA